MSAFWMISLFWISILLFVIVALAFVLPPLLRKKPQAASIDRSIANIAIYQDQLQELEADLKSGELNQDQYASAKLEIAKRLSEDVPTQVDSAAAAQSGRWAGFVLAGIIPVVSIALYLVLGSPETMIVPHAKTAQEGQHDAAAMIASLENKLKQHPDNAEGWYMLGRSYATMGRFKEAAQALGKTAELMPNDARVLADYADALAMTQDGNLEGKPQELINKALELNSQDAKVLNLAAAAAYQRKNFAQAATYWRRLLKITPQDTDFYREITLAMNEAEKAAGKPSGSEASSGLTEKPQAEKPVGASDTVTSVSGTVSVSADLRAKVSPDDTVFIYAQAPQGPKMPLAILKIQARQLPYRFTLDDTMAMGPNGKLSNHPEIMASARVSKSGQAMAQPGDLQGKVGPVKLGRNDLSISIDSVVR